MLVLKRQYNLSDEHMEYQLLDRMSYQRFCLLQDSMNVPDRNSIWLGYKLSVSVDHKYGFIRAVATGAASEHDGHYFDEVLDQRNTGKEVNADRAYPGAQRRQLLAALGFMDGMQRKAQRGRPLSECQERRNQRIARPGAGVEHVFTGIRHTSGKIVRSIGVTRATATMTMVAPCYNLKRLASFLENGVGTFLKSRASKRQVRMLAG